MLTVTGHPNCESRVPDFFLRKLCPVYSNHSSILLFYPQQLLIAMLQKIEGGFFYVQRSYPINIWIIAVTSTVANRSGNLDHSRGSGICPASVTADSPKPCRFRQTAGQDPG